MQYRLFTIYKLTKNTKNRFRNALQGHTALSNKVWQGLYCMWQLEASAAILLNVMILYRVYNKMLYSI
jgi:hypothetical protein